LTVRVAVVGAGYMGSAHARVVSRIADENPSLVSLKYIVDIDFERARRVAARYGGKPLKSVEEMGEVDLAIIATPTETHRKVFESLLGKASAVLVEKPIAQNLEDSIAVVEEAARHGVKLYVGHIERFNPAVRALHTRIARGELGDVLTIVARRVGPFAPRAQNTDVVYDLGIHEVDNALVIYGSRPERVRSYTLGGLVSKLTDYALIILGYPAGFASIEVNRITQFKQRMLYLTTRTSTAYLDYMSQTLRIRRGYEEANVLFKREEPLYLEDTAVVLDVAGEKQLVVDGLQGLLGIYICELALESRVKGRDLAFEEHPAYGSVSDMLTEGERRLKEYREGVASLPP